MIYLCSVQSSGFTGRRLVDATSEEEATKIVKADFKKQFHYECRVVKLKEVGRGA